MKNNLFRLICGLTFLWTVPAQADVYIEKTATLIGPMLIKIWTKGQMQRMEMTMAMMGITSPSSNITIQRFDKGVTWSINEKNKSYIETPLTPSNSQAFTNPDLINQLNKLRPPCTVSFENISEMKLISGFKATGLMEWCQETPDQKRIYWFGVNNDLLFKIKNELKDAQQNPLTSLAFDGMYEKELFNKMSDADRSEYSNRMLLSVEASMNGHISPLMTIQTLSTSALDTALFELPQGYVADTSLQPGVNDLPYPNPVTR